jgi:pilus assembly protein CpaE
MTSRNTLFLISSRPAFGTDLDRMLAGAASPRLAGRSGLPGGAQAALEALRTGTASAVLIDLDGDHAEAMRLLRDIVSAAPDARVLAASDRREPDLILEAMRAGAADFLSMPIERQGLEDALGRDLRRGSPEPGASGGRGRVISFVGAKGGCGATSVAVNLSVALTAQPARTGRSLVLVDLDAPGGDVSAMLQLAPSYSLADVASNTHRLDMDLLNSMLVKDDSGIQCLAASAEGDNPMPLSGIGPDRLASVVEFLRDSFDTVVLAGGGLGETEMGALNVAHMVHVVTTLDFLSLRRAQSLIERLRAFGVHGDALRVVVNRVERGGDLTMSDARQALEAPVVWSIPSDPRTAERAVNEGVPFLSLGKSRLASSYEEYAGLLAGGGGEASAGLGGLFRRLVPGRAGIAG